MSEAFERRSKRNGLWRLARRLLLAFVVAIIGGALDFATRHSVQRIVLVAVFTNLREEAALVVGGPLSYLLSENYDNRRALAELSRRSPPPRVDIFHGTKDDIIPVRMGRELAESFPGFARFHPVNGGDHLSPLFTATDKILAAMND